jgi:hypothetical protein
LGYIRQGKSSGRKAIMQTDNTARYPLKIQSIRSSGQNQRFYVYLPMPLAAALGVKGGEAVEWELINRKELYLIRKDPPKPKAPRCE